MKFFSKLLFIPLFFLFLSITGTTVFADAKSDYEYQYSQYRQNYIEYSVLKNDFLENPTLDNQQKAVLVAKQTIQSRDLAKANFASYLISLCQEDQTNYAPIKPILDSLNAAKLFFYSEAEKSQSIIIPTDLNTFSTDYVINAKKHDISFRTGVIACKISQLVRIQIQSKNALDIMLPKLATPFSTPLKARIDDLQSKGNEINDTINTMVEKLVSDEQVGSINSGSYFSKYTQTIKKIQSLQLKWIDSLIDVDLNYAHS